MDAVTLMVFRGDARGGAEEAFEVPVQEGMVVLDAIFYIQANHATDLAARWNCKAAKCGSCSAEINGRPRLMCKTRVDEFGDKPQRSKRHGTPDLMKRADEGVRCVTVQRTAYVLFGRGRSAPLSLRLRFCEPGD